MSDLKASQEQLLRRIQRLVEAKSGRSKGILFRHYQGTEVGIPTYNYEVATPAGVHSGYWTDRRPRLPKDQIVSRIVANEECEPWDNMDEARLAEYLAMLESLK